MKSGEGFFIYRSIFESIKLMTPEDSHALMLAVYQYMDEGVEPELEGTALIAWINVKPNLDATIAKREAGRKGGSERVRKSSKSEAKGKQTSSKRQADVKQTSSKPQAIKDKGLKIKESTGVDEKRTRENVEMYLREKDYTQLNATEVYDKLESENVRLWQRYIDTWAASTPKPVVTHTPDVSTKEARYRAMMGL